MNNCKGTTLEENSVDGDGLSSVGFDTNDSPEQVFCCNTTSDTQLGITFRGVNCDGTGLNTNIMSNSSESGLSLNNAVIGAQYLKGNLWCEGDVAAINPDQFSIQSPFFVGGHTSTNSCLYLPPNNGNNWFNTIPGENPECSKNSCSQGFEPLPRITASALKAARQEYTGEHSETMNWMAGMYLLDNIDRYSAELLGAESDLDNFYNTNRNTTIGGYLDMRNDIQELFDIDVSTVNQLTQLQNNIERYSEVISSLFRQMLQTTNENELQRLYQEKEMKESLLMADFETQQTILNEIEQERKSLVNNLTLQNRSLATPHIAASNEKWVNAVALISIKNPSFPFRNNIKQKMKNIANQCPASGGLAVYLARGWYDYIEPGNQIDYSTVDNCYNSNNNSQNRYETEITNDANKNLEQVSIYPNPTTGKIEVQLQEMTEGTVIISDMLGKEIVRKKIPANQGQLEFDLSAHKGVLLITIQESEGMIKTEKIIVQ